MLWHYVIDHNRKIMAVFGRNLITEARIEAESLQSQFPFAGIKLVTHAYPMNERYHVGDTLPKQ